MKQRNVFDTTVTDDDRDNIGAYVRSSDGTLITHTTVSAKEALDVYVAGGVDLEVDLSHIDDSVRLGDGTNFLTSTSENGDIALDVHLSNSNIEVTQGTSPWVIGDGGGSITVDAVDLDIRDLTAASDSVQAWAYDGAGTALTSTLVNSDQALDVHISDTEIAVIQGSDSPWAVEATDLDIRDLTHASDSVRLGDGTTLTTVTTVGSDNGLDVYNLNDPSTANTDFATTKTSVTSTSTDLIATALSNRKGLLLANNGNKTMFIGKTTATTDDFPLAPGAYLDLKLGAAIDLKAVTFSGTADARMLEYS